MPSRLPVALSVLTVALSLGLSGCGGDDAKTTKPKPTKVVITGPGSTPSVNFDTGKQFVAALAGNSASSLATAKSLTAPKSAAARYVAKAEGELTAGAGALTVTDKGDGVYRLCSAAGACTKIDQMVLIAGKVATFKVNGKQVR